MKPLYLSRPGAGRSARLSTGRGNRRGPAALARGLLPALVFAVALAWLALPVASQAPGAPESPAASPAAASRTLDDLALLDGDRRLLRTLSFRAEIATPKSGGRWGRSTLNFAWQTPRSWRSELVMGIEGRLVTVADGTRVWQHETRTRRVYVQDQDRTVTQLRTQGPIDPITALASPEVPLSDLFRVTNAVDSGPNRILTLVPRRGVPGYDQLRLAITANGRTPVWAESVRTGRIVARVTFRDWRRNGPVAAGTFRFTPPRGVIPTVIS